MTNPFGDSPANAFGDKPTRQAKKPSISGAGKAIDESVRGVTEATAAMASNLAAKAIAGPVGVGQAFNPFAEPGAADRAVRQVESALTYQPRSERGQSILAQLPEFGPVKLMTDAADFTRTGDKTLESTGNVTLATLNEMFPEIVGSIFSIAGIRGNQGRLDNKRQTKIDKNLRLEPDIKGKAAIADKLRNNPDLPETAGFKLVGGRVVKDPAGRAAMSQGWADKTVSGVKAANASTKSQIRKMIDVAFGREKGTLRDEILTRASDVQGRSLHQRYKFLEGANKSAGRQLGNIAKGLEDIPVDINPALNRFMGNLQEYGVRMVNGKLDFTQSRLPAGDRAVITDAIKQINLARGKGLNFNTAHQLKQDLRRSVKFQKGRQLTKGPISSETDTMLKQVSRDIDGVLDGWSSAYDKANVKFGETAEILDAIQDLVKKRLQTKSAGESMGKLLRRLTGNPETREPLIDILGDMDAVTKKYGGNFQDDIVLQQGIVNQMDDVLGPAARTSLQGDVGAQLAATMEKSSAGQAAHLLDKTVDMVRGRSPEKALGTLWRIAR